MEKEFDPPIPDEFNEERQELLRISMLQTHDAAVAAYALMQNKIKSSKLPKALEFIQIAEPAQKAFEEEIQKFYPEPLKLWEIGREQKPQNDTIKCAKFFAKYFQLLLIHFSFYNNTYSDFHFIIGPNEKDRLEILKDKNREQVSEARTIFDRLKKAKEISDQHLSNNNDFENRDYKRGKNTDYLFELPYSAITDDDIEIMHQILKKTLHWNLFSPNDTSLLQERKSASRTKARKIDTQIANINDGYIREFYKLFFVLGITTSDSAKIIKQCLEAINMPIKTKYEGTDFAKSFVYAKATIEDKIKEIKPSLEHCSLKELIPQN